MVPAYASEAHITTIDHPILCIPYCHPLRIIESTAFTILAKTIWNRPNMMANQNILMSEKKKPLTASGTGNTSPIFAPKKTPLSMGIINEPRPRN
jgi:hypothetical protein